MRGRDIQQAAIFSTISPESQVPQGHPLRAIKVLVNEILSEMSPQFERIYAREGRPSVAPEMLLRALLLQIFYTVRSERMLIEQLHYNLLFRWFVGLSMDDAVWVPTTFSKNRERLLKDQVITEFFQRVVAHAGVKGLLSDEHFTVDGTQIEAWASQKSFVPRGEVLPEAADDDDAGGKVSNHVGSGKKAGRDRNPTVDFRGEKRSNATHYSQTDPDSRLMSKGGGHARLSFYGHVLMENRSGLAVDVELTHANGKSEREAAITMLERRGGGKRVTLGADKGYDEKKFVAAMRALNVTPHVAQNQYSAIDGRVTRHEGYAISGRKRKRVEEIFGWMKTVGALRKTRHKGLAKVGDNFALTAAAYNLVRIRNLTKPI